ncbi:MAG: hypothetical protein ABFD60_15215 [Bryobacteraceae bacterium]
MPNTNAPFGFVPYRGNGAAPTYELSTRLIKSDNTTKIFQGDPVVPLTTGYITQMSAGGTVRCEGIFWGCKYLSTSQKRTVWSNFWPGADASSDVEAYLYSSPNMQFEVQSSDASGTAAIGLANIGEYINIGYGIGLAGTPNGNTATGLSTASVDQDTLATTVTHPFIVVGLVEAPPGSEGTDTASEYNRVIVAFNNASSRTNGAGPTGIA